MEVKIVKATLPTYWYAKEIGQVFKVEPDPTEDFDYKVIESGFGRYIKQSDCAILNNKKMNNIPPNAVPVLMEKPEVIYLSDLKNSDHIGVILEHKNKGHVVTYGKNEFVIIGMETGEHFCNNMYHDYSNTKGIHHAFTMANGYVTAIYKFTDRRSLYKWLAED